MPENKVQKILNSPIFNNTQIALIIFPDLPDKTAISRLKTRKNRKTPFSQIEEDKLLKAIEEVLK